MLFKIDVSRTVLMRLDKSRSSVQIYETSHREQSARKKTKKSRTTVMSSNHSSPVMSSDRRESRHLYTCLYWRFLHSLRLVEMTKRDFLVLTFVPYAWRRFTPWGVMRCGRGLRTIHYIVPPRLTISGLGTTWAIRVVIPSTNSPMTLQGYAVFLNLQNSHKTSGTLWVFHL